MNPDHVERALAALPRFDSDERRAARTRMRCQLALQRRAPAVVRVTSSIEPIALTILQPVAIAGCFLFLMMMLGTAVRIVSLTPW
jgi:hypothetical protein